MDHADMSTAAPQIIIRASPLYKLRPFISVLMATEKGFALKVTTSLMSRRMTVLDRFYPCCRSIDNTKISSGRHLFKPSTVIKLYTKHPPRALQIVTSLFSQSLPPDAAEETTIIAAYEPLCQEHCRPWTIIVWSIRSPASCNSGRVYSAAFGGACRQG